MRSITRSLSAAKDFVKRQQRDWVITVIRTSLEKFSYQTVYPYLSVYVVALGATATELGLVNSIGMIVSGIAAPLVGVYVDRTGPKRFYLLGIGLLAISYLTYGVARSWPTTIAAMAVYWLGFSISQHSCATICGNCLLNEDRATGMTICESIAAGALGMAGPALGAWMVTCFGGTNVAGIRPVFFFCLAITTATFIIVLTKLSNTGWRRVDVAKASPVRDLHQVFKEGSHLKKWLAITTIYTLPLAMVFPFFPLYAHERKGATAFVLGMMITASALVSMVFAIPLGRLADKIGRKKVLYVTAPLFWASSILLLASPNVGTLITAGGLQGFYYIAVPIGGAMERELVPPEQMGRWIGIGRFFRMTVTGCMALLCGIIWDKVGPQYVLLLFVALDLGLRIPLLSRLPETLGARSGR
jgi:DHA1 family multidrug resistance protein-like MFS transporter